MKAKQTVRTLSDLVRLPNVITAVSDSLAGYLYLSSCSVRWGDLLILAIASACFYAGGVTLNDYCDVEQDRRERPQRPVPSGRVSPRTALSLSVGLLLAGLGSCIGLSLRTALVGTALITAIVTYNVFLKRSALGPGIMGLCRAFNLMLGMSVTAMPFSLTTIVPIVAIWLYVTSITFFAQDEAKASRSSNLHRGTLGIGVAVIMILILGWSGHRAGVGFVLTGVGFLAFLIRTGYRAAQLKDRADIQHAVKQFVLGIIVFDSILIWPTAGALWATLLCALVIPAWLLAKFVRVT